MFSLYRYNCRGLHKEERNLEAVSADSTRCEQLPTGTAQPAARPQLYDEREREREVAVESAGGGGGGGGEPS
uniref:Uncharacterized protein n=1 Tax=Arundo donax TaxID=35708 RepID=A0A0A9FLF5_ARUDO